MTLGSEEQFENFKPNLRLKSVSPDLIPVREAYEVSKITPTYQKGKQKIRMRNFSSAT